MNPAHHQLKHAIRARARVNTAKRPAHAISIAATVDHALAQIDALPEYDEHTIHHIIQFLADRPSHAAVIQHLNQIQPKALA